MALLKAWWVVWELQLLQFAWANRKKGPDGFETYGKKLPTWEWKDENWERDVIQCMLERSIWCLVFTHVFTLSSTNIADCRHIRSSWRGAPHQGTCCLGTFRGFWYNLSISFWFLGFPQISPRNSDSTRGAPRVFAWWRWLWKKGQRWKFLICCQLECFKIT